MFENMSKEEIFAARDEAIDRMRWAERVIDEHISGENRHDNIAKIHQIMREEEAKVKEANEYMEKMGWDDEDDDN